MRRRSGCAWPNGCAEVALVGALNQMVRREPLSFHLRNDLMATTTVDAPFSMQPIGPDDIPALLALNNSAVPHVNDLDAAAFQAIVDEAAVAVKAVNAGRRRGRFRPGAGTGKKLCQRKLRVVLRQHGRRWIPVRGPHRG